MGLILLDLFVSPLCLLDSHMCRRYQAPGRLNLPSLSCRRASSHRAFPQEHPLPSFSPSLRSPAQLKFLFLSERSPSDGLQQTESALFQSPGPAGPGLYFCPHCAQSQSPGSLSRGAGRQAADARAGASPGSGTPAPPALPRVLSSQPSINVIFLKYL